MRRASTQIFRPGVKALALLLALAVALSLAVTAPVARAAETALVQDQHIQVALVSAVARPVPGEPFWVALRLIPEEGWHTYWRNSGDSGLPTRISWRLPQGAQADAIAWPLPERIDYLGLINYGYHGDTLLLTRIQPPAQRGDTNALVLEATARWLVCADICIPGQAELKLSLPWSETDSPETSAWADRIESVRAALPEPAAFTKAEFSVTDRVELRLDLAELQREDAAFDFGAPEHMAFFPIDAEIVVNAEAPRIQASAAGLNISLARDPDLEQMPESFAGLLVLERNGQQRGYEFVAQPDPTQASLTLAARPATSAQYNGLSLALVLLLAVAGGLVLNLMPCVFPVLSIKVMSLIEANHGAPGKARLHGLAYMAGVVTAFIVIAALLLGFRAGGETLGWGFQLQSPWFVAALAYLFFLMGLSLSGLVEIGMVFTRAGNLLGKGSGLNASFFTGVLATIVATPCTAPFMGTAMGYAMTQPTAVALLVFVSLGIGLALPFVILTAVPRLTALLPRPGRWMETLKQLLAFPLYLTVVWLLWVFSRQTDSNALAAILLGMVLLAFALWLWRLGLNSAASRGGNRLTKGLALAALLSAIAIPATLEQQGLLAVAPRAETSQGWSLAAQQAALQAGRPVFVNLTADWCITCKVNERLVLRRDSTEQLFRANEVEYLVGDWTNGDPSITALLSEFGRSGVPLYILYLPGKAPQVLPQILTPTALATALSGV